MNYYHVIGPPGTGKTKTLIDVIEECLAEGVEPQKIGFCSFTRAAVREAQKHLEKFKLSSSSLPFFGTIHSLCYRQLGINKGDVFNKKAWEEFCSSASLPFTKEGPDVENVLDEPWEPMGKEEGDVLRHWYDWARNGCLDLEESIKKYDAPPDVIWTPARALWFARSIEEYKSEKGFVDFVDMLKIVDKQKWVPDIDVLILDEAQDLSPLQRRIFQRWARAAKKVYMGYDPDQCVYGFQLADPMWLIDFPGERYFLDKSFRVPKRPANLAQRLISKNWHRYPHTWNPKEEQGEIHFDVAMDILLEDIARSEETWFLLARNNLYLNKYSSRLLENAIPFNNLRGASPMEKMPVSVIAAIRLATGMEVNPKELHKLAEDSPTEPWWRWGAKTRIKTASKENPELDIYLKDLKYYGAMDQLIEKLSNLNTCLVPLKKYKSLKDYYLRVYKKYGFPGLQNRPNVTLGSFHSVKGRQADNVVVLPNMTKRTSESYAQDPEPERRAWYVAFTRCQKRLYILEPTQKNFFDEW